MLWVPIRSASMRRRLMSTHKMFLMFLWQNNKNINISLVEKCPFWSYARTYFHGTKNVWAIEVWSQLAFYVNLYRAVIGPSATLTGRWRPDIDLRRMLTGIVNGLTYLEQRLTPFFINIFMQLQVPALFHL